MSASSSRKSIKSQRSGNYPNNRQLKEMISSQHRALMRQSTVRDLGPWSNVQFGRLPSTGVYGRPGNSEVKGCDYSLAVSPILATTNTNGSEVTVNLVAPGTGSYNRVGRKIRMKSLRIKGNFLYSYTRTATTGDLPAQVIRMVVVYDQQPSGVVPTYDTVFGRTIQDGTESTQYLDPIKYDSMGRFKILRECCFEMNPKLWNNEGGTTDLTEIEAHFDEYIKLNGLETVYSGQSSPCTIADVSTGGLYIFFRSDKNITGTSVSSIGANSFARLRYYD